MIVQNAALFTQSTGENEANELNPLKAEVNEPKNSAERRGWPSKKIL